MFDITFIHIMCFLIYIISIFLYRFYSHLFTFHVNGLPNNLLVFSFCIIYMSLVLATFISCPYKVKFIYLFITANIVPPVLLFIANIAICISYSLVYIFHIDIALLDLNQSVLKMSCSKIDLPTPTYLPTYLPACLSAYLSTYLNPAIYLSTYLRQRSERRHYVLRLSNRPAVRPSVESLFYAASFSYYANMVQQI